MQVFQDEKGHYSMMRVSLFVIVSFVMLTWTVVSIKNGDLIEFSPSQLYLVGIAIGSKSLQRFAEKR